MKLGGTTRPMLQGTNLSTEPTRHNSPTYAKLKTDPGFDPKDTARLQIPRTTLSTRVFETLPESGLPSIEEEFGDEDKALNYLASAAGYLKRQTTALDSLDATITDKQAHLQTHELDIESRLDSLEQCQRVYIASTELAKDQLMRSRAMLQAAGHSDTQRNEKIHALKTSNRTLIKAKNTLSANSDSFESFYSQFKEEKAAFLEELRQFNKEKEQLLVANQSMQQTQSDVDKKLQLISTRLQEISAIRSDFTVKYTQKKRKLAEREAEIAAKERDLEQQRSDMERMWREYEADWKKREEMLRGKESELQRKIAHCDELLGLKEELDREKEGMKERETEVIRGLRRKEEELEARERDLEELARELETQREFISAESPYPSLSGEERWERLEMQREDVLSVAMRLELFESSLISKEENLLLLEEDLTRERMEIDSTARMLESLHQDLENAKGQVAAQRESTHRDQQSFDRERTKVESICRELERQRTELESKEKALDSASRRLKERERVIELAEKGLRKREQQLEAPLCNTVDTSRLEELRCKRQEMRQRDKSPDGKWMDTEASRAELRRINQMLQESYLTPRGVMTPISPEVSPELPLSTWNE